MYNEAPAMDITRAAEQDEIANSLLGDDLETEESSETSDVTYDVGEPAERTPEDIAADSLVDQPEVESDEQTQQFEAPPEQVEEIQQAPVDLSPQAIQQGIERLDQAVTELGLNDEAAAKSLAYDLSAPFGSDPSEINSQALGSTLAKMTLSAVQIFNAANADPANMPGPIPRDSAIAFTNDFLRAWGIDPRNSSVDPGQFSSVMLSGAMNFLDAVNTYGVNASLDRLNTAEGAQWFANALHRCFGNNEPVSRERALAIADAGGKYMLSILRKLGSQAQAQPTQQRSARSPRGASRQSQSKRARSKFSTNQDIFNEETMAFLGRL